MRDIEFSDPDTLEFYSRDTAGIGGADHLTVKKRAIAAGKHVSAIWKCHPKNTVHPLCRDKGVILLDEKSCSPICTVNPKVVAPFSHIQQIWSDHSHIQCQLA